MPCCFFLDIPIEDSSLASSLSQTTQLSESNKDFVLCLPMSVFWRRVVEVNDVSIGLLNAQLCPDRKAN